MPSLFPDDRKPQQRVLDFAHPSASGREDFLCSPSNQAAVAWIDKWPDWPGVALVLCGPAGSGKSHLARIWAARAGALGLDATGLSTAMLASNLSEDRAIVLEGAQSRSGDADFEEAFFHLYNGMNAAKRSLMIVAVDPPARWPLRLPDLASRLASVPVAGIEAPDDALLEKLFYKLFADRQLQVSPEVVAYLLPRMERSFGAVHAIVDRLDRTALARQAPVTLGTARAALAESFRD